MLKRFIRKLFKSKKTIYREQFKKVLKMEECNGSYKHNTR